MIKLVIPERDKIIKKKHITCNIPLESAAKLKIMEIHLGVKDRQATINTVILTLYENLKNQINPELIDEYMVTSEIETL